MYQRLQYLQPWIRHRGRADIGLNGTEREIGSLGLTRTDTVEKSGLTHIGESDYTAFQRHILIILNYKTISCATITLRNMDSG